MENQPERPNHEIKQINPMDMHAPIETTILIGLSLPDGRTAGLKFEMTSGVIPTRAEIKAVVDACTPESLRASDIPKGARLMTKPEFVAMMTKRATGIAIPMPGDQSFVPANCEIPKEILIDAIHGVGAPRDSALESDYIQRGWANYGKDGEPDWTWTHEALAKLPDDILLALYRRITA